MLCSIRIRNAKNCILSDEKRIIFLLKTDFLHGIIMGKFQCLPTPI